MDNGEEHGDHADQAVVDDQAVQAVELLLPDDDHRQAVDNQGEAQDGDTGEEVNIVSWLVNFHCIVQQ